VKEEAAFARSFSADRLDLSRTGGFEYGDWLDEGDARRPMLSADRRSRSSNGRGSHPDSFRLMRGDDSRDPSPRLAFRHPSTIVFGLVNNDYFENARAEIEGDLLLRTKNPLCLNLSLDQRKALLARQVAALVTGRLSVEKFPPRRSQILQMVTVGLIILVVVLFILIRVIIAV
jgi:hypothetical protein